MHRRLAAILVIATLVSSSHVARASAMFPDLIKQQLGVSCAPACTICHNNPNGGAMTVTTPFGQEMRFQLGLVGQNPASLQKALDQLKAQNLSAIGDGIPDYQALMECMDPNVAPATVNSDGGTSSGGAATPANLPETPQYGCAVGRAPAGVSGGAVLLVVGILARRRRAPGPLRTPPPQSNTTVLLP